MIKLSLNIFVERVILYRYFIDITRSCICRLIRTGYFTNIFQRQLSTYLHWCKWLFWETLQCVRIKEKNTTVRYKAYLRYYAFFKVRKFESWLYKINTCLQKTTTCIGLRAEQMLYVNIWYTNSSILGVAFTVPFLCYFQKLQLLDVKRFWTNFCWIVLLYLWAQKVCLTFLKSFFKLEILVFLSFIVSLLVDMLNYKPPFLTKKISAMKSETHFRR